jgi:thioredoxin 1
MEIIKLTKENFDSIVKNSDKKVVVDFNADWCGPCRMLAPVLEELAETRTDIIFASVNVDDEEKLANNYNVYSIPCLILFKNGNELKRSVGFKQKDELEAFLGE